MHNIKILILFLACSFLAVAQQGSDTSTQSKPSLPHMIRFSGEALGRQVDHVELPKYPEAALQARTHGDVILKVMVDESGKVILSSPVEGDPLLTAASVDALREFRFRPVVLDGVPLRVDSEVEFQFSIHGHGADPSGKVKYQPSVTFRPEFRTGVAAD